MKRILITGANSYIGTSVERYLGQWPEKYRVDTLDMIDGTWRERSFAGYDAVYHVVGIAHSDIRRISDERKALHYRVNTDIAVEACKKAKADGVRQFIFMSSAIVYGDSAPVGVSKMITRDTPFSPFNFYGDSKVKAEEGIAPLRDDGFRVAILRPPMVYGKGCKGTYTSLVKYALKLPFFPCVNNARSMLYIGNLTEFVRLIIDNEDSGVFWPQNAEYSNTSELVALINMAHGRKARFIKGCTWLLKITSLFTGQVNKAFGNFTYDQSMSLYKEEYRKYSLRKSIELTEGRENHTDA